MLGSSSHRYPTPTREHLREGDRYRAGRGVFGDQGQATETTVHSQGSDRERDQNKPLEYTTK